MNDKRDRFFNNEAYNIYKDHLPVNLYSRLVLIGLMDKKQIEHKLEDKRRLTIKLTVNDKDILLPSSISITIINTYLINESDQSNQLTTKKSVYTFCKKNVASWSVIDNKIEDSGSNPSAYVVYENVLLKEQTDQYVREINQEANKVKLGMSKPNQQSDDACACTLF